MIDKQVFIFCQELKYKSMKKIVFLTFLIFPLFAQAQKTKKALKYIVVDTNYTKAKTYLDKARKAGKDSTKIPTTYNYTWGLYHLQNNDAVQRDTIQAKRYFIASQKAIQNLQKKDKKILDKYQIDQRRIQEKIKKCEKKITNDIIVRKDTTIKIIEKTIEPFNDTIIKINAEIIAHQQKLINAKQDAQNKLRVQISLKTDAQNADSAYTKLSQILETEMPKVKKASKGNLDYNYEVNNQKNGFTLDFDVALEPSSDSLKLKDYSLGVYKNQILDTYVAKFTDLLLKVIKETGTPIMPAKVNGTITGMADAHKLRSIKYKGEMGKVIDSVTFLTAKDTLVMHLKKGEDLKNKGGNTALAFLRAYNAHQILDTNFRKIPNLQVEEILLKAIASPKTGGEFRNVTVSLAVDIGKKELVNKIDYISKKIQENKKLIDQEKQAIADAKALKRGQIQNSDIAKHKQAILKYKKEIDKLMLILEDE